MSLNQLERAKKKVKKKKEFYDHLSAFIAVGFFFVVMNIITEWGDPRPEVWAIFPMLGWSIGLIIHYFSVFGIPFMGNKDEDWEEKEIGKELCKIQRREGYEVNEDYESLDLYEKQMVKEKYDDTDLV